MPFVVVGTDLVISATYPYHFLSTTFNDRNSYFMKSLINASTGISCLLVILFVAATLPASAINYYVNPSSWGSNQGTFSDPWKSLDDIPEDINFFKPGDTVFFQRGQQYYGTLSINSSGSDGAPIVFMPYGSGNAPLFQYKPASPAEALVVNRMIIRLNQVNHVVIDGFELTDASISAADHSASANVGHGVHIYKGAANNGSYNVIKNLTISRLGAGVTIDGGSYNTVTGCTIKDMRMSVNTPDIGWDDHGAVGITIGGSNNTITHNRIQECWATSFDFKFDGGAIEMYGAVNNNSILYNTAIDNLGFMEFGSGTGAQALNNIVGYNLLINNGHICWINIANGFSIDVRNLQFLNNNIVETNPPRIADITSLIGIFSTPSVSNVITLKNNIFWITRPGNITDPVTQPFNGPQLVHENNIYRLGGGSLGFTMDASEKNLNAGDLLFMDNTPGNPEFWNYDLQLSSAAINFGGNTGILKDFFGRSVPFGNAPDAGISESISQVLPLQITSFRGWNTKDGNQLEWETTNETAEHFVIEKSKDGKNFSQLAVVPFKSNTGAKTTQYRSIDKDVKEDVRYYRIKVITQGSAAVYSPIINVRSSLSSNNLKVAPNPVRDNLFVSISANDFRNKEIVVFNISGVALKRTRVNVGNSPIKINVSELPHGAYVVKCIDRTTGNFSKAMFTK